MRRGTKRFHIFWRVFSFLLSPSSLFVQSFCGSLTFAALYVYLRYMLSCVVSICARIRTYSKKIRLRITLLSFSRVVFCFFLLVNSLNSRVLSSTYILHIGKTNWKCAKKKKKYRDVGTFKMGKKETKMRRKNKLFHYRKGRKFVRRYVSKRRYIASKAFNLNTVLSPSLRITFGSLGIFTSRWKVPTAEYTFAKVKKILEQHWKLRVEQQWCFSVGWLELRRDRRRWKKQRTVCGFNIRRDYTECQFYFMGF